MEEAKTFFSPSATEEWRRALLARYNIDYLFYGPRERALVGFEPEKAGYLEKVYANSLVTIYRVAKE